VIAPDKFKGSLSALEAASAIEHGVLRAAPAMVTRCIPMADGGEGTVDAFVESGWTRVVVEVAGPRGEPVQAAYAQRGTAAVIEMAGASGLALLPPEGRAPLHATSYGTGQLVRAALDRGADHLILGLGGSATNDGGAGFLQALGVRLLDRAGNDLEPGGAALADLARIDAAGLDPRLADAKIESLTDVANPLTGPHGASTVFGPQKGASAEDVLALDAALAHFADLATEANGVDVRDEPGSGAAGGLGFALHAFLGARPRPGVEVVAELRGLAAALADADWCFTGEGSIDAQTLAGKTVLGVARLARAAGVPVIAFGGRVAAEAEAALAAQDVLCVPIADGPSSDQDAFANAAALLERAAYRTMRLLAG
jgi:glycerate kinase